MPSMSPDAHLRALVAEQVTSPTPVDDEIDRLNQLMALAELLAETDDRWDDYQAYPLVRETYLDMAVPLLPALRFVMSGPPQRP